jgi:FMN phosphatase YigB (HAD superfamily)
VCEASVWANAKAEVLVKIKAAHFWDDEPENIQAAKAAGIECTWVRDDFVPKIPPSATATDVPDGDSP